MQQQTDDVKLLKIRTTREAVGILHDTILGPHAGELQQILSMWQQRRHYVDGGDSRRVNAAEFRERRVSIDMDDFCCVAFAVAVLRRLRSHRVFIPAPIDFKKIRLLQQQQLQQQQASQQQQLQGQSNTVTRFRVGSIRSVAAFLIGKNPFGAETASPPSTAPPSATVATPPPAAATQQLQFASEKDLRAAGWINHVLATFVSSPTFLATVEEKVNEVLRQRAEALEASQLAHTVSVSFSAAVNNAAVASAASTDSVPASSSSAAAAVAVSAPPLMRAKSGISPSNSMTSLFNRDNGGSHNSVLAGSGLVSPMLKSPATSSIDLLHAHHLHQHHHLQHQQHQHLQQQQQHLHHHQHHEHEFLRNLPVRIKSLQILQGSGNRPDDLRATVELALGDCEAPSHRIARKAGAVSSAEGNNNNSLQSSSAASLSPELSFNLAAHVAVGFGRFLPVTVVLRNLWLSVIKINLVVQSVPLHPPTTSPAAMNPTTTTTPVSPSLLGSSSASPNQQHHQRTASSEGAASSSRDPSSSRDASRSNSPTLQPQVLLNQQQQSTTSATLLTPTKQPQLQRQKTEDIAVNSAFFGPSMNDNNSSDDGTNSHNEQHQMQDDEGQQQEDETTPLLPPCQYPMKFVITGYLDSIGDAEFELRSCLGPKESMLHVEDWMPLTWLVQREARKIVQALFDKREETPLFKIERVLPA